MLHLACVDATRSIGNLALSCGSPSGAPAARSLPSASTRTITANGANAQSVVSDLFWIDHIQVVDEAASMGYMVVSYAGNACGKF
jgi:hypothetical protein